MDYLYIMTWMMAIKDEQNKYTSQLVTMDLKLIKLTGWVTKSQKLHSGNNTVAVFTCWWGCW